MRLVLATLLFAGCASAGAGADRHATASAALTAPRQTWALEGVYLAPTRAGQLAASREWERTGGDRVITAGDDAVLRDDFSRDLGRVLTLDAAAPRRIRATLTLQSPAYFEGLAAETADVTLTADILDDSGNVTDSITLREAASAPLQRSASRQQRLAPAFDRLAVRLAKELAQR